MAPQNSTLIHEKDIIDATSELNASPYSPILPLRKEERHDVFNRRKKSILDQSYINTIKEDEEIPIWICGEPRFISGITNTTTCNDVIQALINDEINNLMKSSTKDVTGSHDIHDYVITERWRDIEQELPGNTNILPIWKAWGAAQNEVKFKLKINKSKLQKLDAPYKPQQNKKCKNINIIQRLIKKIRNQSEQIHVQLFNTRPSIGNEDTTLTVKRKIDIDFETEPFRKCKARKSIWDSLCDLRKSTATLKKTSNQTDESDEIFLLINSTERNERLKFNFNNNYCKRKNNLSKLASPSKRAKNDKIQNILPSTYLKLSSSSSQYLSIKSIPNSLNYSNSMKIANNDDDLIIDTKNTALEHEILCKKSEIQKLIKFEKELRVELSKICNMYKEENELYRKDIDPDICIENIQKNLKEYSDKIIQHELELYRINIEIDHKLALLKNFKRMLLKNDNIMSGESGNKNCIKTVEEFVDNIHEFCDNNDSIIV